MNRAIVVLLLLIANVIVSFSKDAARHRDLGKPSAQPAVHSAPNESFLLSAVTRRSIDCLDIYPIDGASPL